jgi:hypothetical protein
MKRNLSSFLPWSLLVTTAVITASMAPLRVQGQGQISWPFSFATTGTNTVWVSPSSVDSVSPAYQYQLETSQLFVLYDVNGQYYHYRGIVVRSVPDSSINSQGIVPGPLPVEMLDSTLVDACPPLNQFVFSADYHAYIGDDGFGRVEVSNLLFGQYRETDGVTEYVYNVVGRTGSGKIPISVIPEPSSYALLFGGLVITGLVLERRRTLPQWQRPSPTGRGQ